jgi:hypothetical protein
MKAYFAAPYIDATKVRRLHVRAHMLGITPVSSWAESAKGAEALDEIPLAEARRIVEMNDRDLASAHVVVALPRDTAGGETHCVVARALEWRIPVIWVGSPCTLSAYREGVLRVDNVIEAMERLTSFRNTVDASPDLAIDAARYVLWSFIEFCNHEAQPKPAQSEESGRAAA